MILFNDPRYGSHLAGDQGQFSILQILIEDVLEGQLVVGRTEVIYHMTSNSSIHLTEMPRVSAAIEVGVDLTMPVIQRIPLFKWTSTLLT
jgi:hypothetical protein